MNIRAATPQDVVLLHELVNSAYRGDSSKKGWTTEADLLGGQRTDPDSLLSMIEDPQAVILLTFEDRDLIGCVFLKNQNTHGYLGMLTVKPTLQSSGLGREILRASEDWVSQKWHLPKMEMQVIRQRGELIAWYERRGYAVTDQRRPFPYGDAKFGLPKVEDLEFVIMEKSLPTADRPA